MLTVVTSGLSCNDERHIQARKDTCRSLVGLFERSDLVQDHHELIAAHAHDDVLCSHRRLNALRNFLQKLVADFMAVRIVDVFEAIEIEEQHRQWRSRLARLLHGHWKVRGEKESIGQTRELVVMSQSIQSLLLLEQLRFDLALNRAPVLGLFEKLFVLRLRPSCSFACNARV